MAGHSGYDSAWGAEFDEEEVCPDGWDELAVNALLTCMDAVVAHAAVNLTSEVLDGSAAERRDHRIRHRQAAALDTGGGRWVYPRDGDYDESGHPHTPPPHSSRNARRPDDSSAVMIDQAGCSRLHNDDLAREARWLVGVALKTDSA